MPPGRSDPESTTPYGRIGADPESILTKVKACSKPILVGAAVVGFGVAVLIALMPHEAPVAPATASQTGSSGASVRLRITNGCRKEELWLAHFAYQTPFFPQDIKLAAGATHEFAIPDAGLAATRFWPKWKCDKMGGACKIGQSGGPGESCPAIGCAPPVDSKFEATFGCLPGTESCEVNPSLPSEKLGPTDWWDVSQVS
mmetsp:Transcript_28853/g.58058  ORF Transcript_28853/g.58058 Transcript_28853/m.58058 type:complete len:200 (-) Transcript_28853:861-1460(-)